MKQFVPRVSMNFSADGFASFLANNATTKSDNLPGQEYYSK